MRYIIFAGLIFLYIFISGSLPEKRKELPKTERVGYILPSEFLRLSSLEFKGVLSDLLFLKTSVFLGGKIGPKGELKLKKEEWEWIYKMLDLITDLDPYFLDPYIFGEGVLTWEAGMIKEMNKLLLKGMRYRNWDWNLPFSLGFNYFYFLKDKRRGAYYIMRASELPGSFPFLPQLAARLKYESGDTYGAIIFLKNMYSQISNQDLKTSLLVRIKALEAIYSLEKGVNEYKRRYHKIPKRIEELIERGIIKRIPEDPYGGKFYLDKDGRVRTTSRLTFVRK